MDLIVNHVAKYRYGKARGDLSLPLVIRTVSGSTGPNFGAGPSHEQSLEALFTHIPGLQVVVPSTPYDVKGFLKSCIQGDDPVLFIEHRSLYGLAGPVPDEEYVLPLGKARIARSGDDLTIVAWSQAVHMALEAAHEVEQKGISVEVVDLRSLRPLDMDTVLDSVRRTGRLMVVHEACRTGGFGAEIVAIVAEAAFGQLLAPIKRVTSLDSPIPVSREQMKRVIVDVEKIIDGVVDLMAPEAALSN
jgi:pyruvate/2-oxoglutarate/acetoin dehydrogenase E1 component